MRMLVTMNFSSSPDIRGGGQLFIGYVGKVVRVHRAILPRTPHVRVRRLVEGMGPLSISPFWTHIIAIARSDGRCAASGPQTSCSFSDRTSASSSARRVPTAKGSSASTSNGGSGRRCLNSIGQQSASWRLEP